MACMQRNFICPIFYNVFKLSLNKKKYLKYFPWFVRFIVFVFVWTSECGNLTIWNSFDDEPPIHWMITTHFMKIALPKFLSLSLFLILSHSKTSLESLKCDECKNSLSLKDWMWIIKFDLNQHLQWISMALIHCLLSTPGMAFKMIEIIWKHT